MARPGDGAGDDVMPVRALPHCAAFAPCAVLVERPVRDPRAPLSRRPCMRRARFVIESPDLPAILACPGHVQMAAMSRVWRASWRYLRGGAAQEP